MADEIKDEGIFQTMSKPYVSAAKSLKSFGDKYFPAYTGIFDAEVRAGYPTSYEEYVDKLVGEDGIHNLTGRDREFYLNHKPTQEHWSKQVRLRTKSLKAQKLSADSGYNIFSKGITSALTDATSFIGSALPGDTFTYDNLRKVKRDFFNLDPKVNVDFLEAYLGRPPTQEEINEAREYIYQEHDMSHLGYGAGVVAEGFAVPYEKLISPIYQAVKKSIRFAPKTTAAGAGAAVAVSPSDAEAGRFDKLFKSSKAVSKTDDVKSLDELSTEFKKVKEAYMSPANAKQVEFYNSKKFKDSVKQKYNELTVYDSNGDILAPPSTRALADALSTDVNKINPGAFKKYGITEELGLKFGAEGSGSFGGGYRRAQNKANKTGKIIPAGKENPQLFFPNETTKIKFLKELKNNVFTGTAGQSNKTQAQIVKEMFEGETQMSVRHINAYLKNTNLTANMAKALNIDPKLVGTKLKEIDAFYYNLPENLPSQSQVDRTAAIKIWKETAPEWQLDLWKNAKKIIAKHNKFFPNDRKALDHIAPFINAANKIKAQHPKNWQILNLDDNNVLKKILFEGVDSKMAAMNRDLNKLKKGSAEYKSLKKQMDEVFQKTIEELTDKSIFYNTAQRNVPIDYRKTNIDKSNNPLDVLKDTLATMDKSTTEYVESLKRIAPGGRGAYPNLKEGGKVIRQGYAELNEEGVQPLTVAGLSTTDSNIIDIPTPIVEVQNDILSRYKRKLAETIRPIREKTNIRINEMLNDTQKVMNKGDRPIEVRPLTEGYKLITDNPLVEAAVASPYTIYNTLLYLQTALYNAATGKNIDVRKKFPTTFEIADRITSGAGETPEDQTYISFIDEINRAQDKGISSLGYNIVDIAASTKDWAFGGEATEKVRASYDKMIKEGKISTPETFIGEVGAIGVEFGLPAGSIFKGVNFLRRMIKAKTGVNLFATQTYGLTGASLFGTRISNVSKRVGTSALTFAGTDLIAGGPYNTATEVFHEDGPLFTYDLIDTEGLSGRDLAVANLKNRLRFGAEGAMIGGLFPLVGPPLWAATKYGAIKPSLYVGGKTLQLGNQLAIKPLSYLAGGTLKAPFSKPGAYEVSIPLMKELNQGIAGGVKTFAEFLGKDIITRATVKAMGASPGFIKQLPDFKDWRMFDVNSKDPLKANLKKIDNVFSYFREAGIRSPDQLYLDVAAQNFIKSKSRQIEKLLDSVEVKAYDLANGFLKGYNKATTSPAGQDYLLDQVLAYIKGQIKLTALPKELQSTAKALSDEFDAVRNLYKDILPDESGLKMFLNTNLKSYIRQSFAMFTNPQFKPNQKLKDDAINFVASRIRNNESLVELAIKGSTQSTEASIRRFAEQQVDDLLATVKTEGIDPIISLQNITKNNLKMDDIVIQTGEELPAVIRKLLGEEGNLRSSVMQTTSSLVTQATNLKNYDRIGQLLLNEGRLFASRDEAIRAGIVNPMPVDRVPGLGLLDSDISKLYGSKEVVSMLRGSLGQLDKFMESSIYQGMIAYKAGVQTGKTVLSPATQTRNFGSAAAFVLNNGWIGGRASVSDAFKITLDDIFGAGRTVNEEELIKNIARKSELGVIDENIVASELSAVLADIKAGKVSTFGKLAGMADNSKLMKTATRLYSGGDNVWKWYAHEYLMSALKGGFRNVDEIKKAVKDDFGITQFNPKNMSEAIEEYAAMMVRELMPTYSKVPPMIQAIRKIPFIGNFVSFPAEIIRTSAATSTLAMKHIASDNATLRAMGYKSLMGQFATLWALNEGARGLGYAMTNITPEQIKTYKDEFAADYMKFSDLVPISNLDKKRGTFKVFDMSRYNPYDLISSTVNNLITRATDPKAKLDPDKIETDVLAEYFNASGPLLDLLNGTLFGLSIGTEGVYEALSGKTKTGSSVWSPSDTFLEKFDKGIMHILNKNEPGVVSSAQRTWSAFSGDVSGTGQPLEIGDEMFKLLGGSTVTVDIPGSFAFKISEFQNTFKEPKVSEGWYSTKNYQNRGPAQLVREYNEMNEEAFRQQYQFYRAVRAALDSGLMTKTQIVKALKDRKIADTTIVSILSGKYKPLSYGEGGLKSRYNKIKNANPDKRFRLSDFLPLGELERAKLKWMNKKFEDFEVERKEPEQVSQAPIVPNTVAVEPEIPVPQVAETGTPVVNPNAMAGVTGVVNPATGLTKTENALLSPGEKAIRQGQRGIA